MLKKHNYHLLLFFPVIVSLLSVHSLILNGYPYGHDWIFELVRIREYSEALKTGQFFPFWSNNLYKGFGAPVFTFYAPLYSALSSLFLFLGATITQAAILSIIFLSIISSISMTLLMREIIGNDLSTLSRAAIRVSVVTYLLAPYLLANFMLRNASAEFTAMCLLPIPLLGLARIYNGYKDGILSLAIGVALIILAHNLTALILVTVLLVLTCVLFLPEKQLFKFKLTLFSLFTGIGLVSWFWLPAFGLKSYVRVSELQIGKLGYENNFKNIYELFGYSEFYSIGLISLFILMISILTLKKNKEYLHLKLTLILASLIFLFLQTSASQFFWENIPFMPLFQFPWRMMGPFSIITAVLAGILFKNHVKRIFLTELIIVSLIVLNAYPHFNKYKPLTEDIANNISLLTMPEQIRHLNLPVTVGDEYLPIAAKKELVNVSSNNEVITYEHKLAKVNILEDSGTLLHFISESDKSFSLKVLRWYFPGWKAYINEEEFPLLIDETGIIKIELPAGKQGVIIRLTQTNWRITGYVITCVFIILLLFLYRKYQNEDILKSKPLF